MYLLGAHEDADRAAVEAHLAGCARCLREADALGPTVDALIMALIMLDPRLAASLLAAHPSQGKST